MAKGDNFPLPPKLRGAPPLSYDRPPWVRRDLADATGAGVRVAVVDSGLDAGWPAAEARLGIDLSDAPKGGNAATHDHLGHGTACASILWSLAPGVEVYPVRIFHRRLESRISVLVRAIEWAVERRMQVVNLSLGTVEKKGFERLYRACEAARRQGLILVAAVEAKSGVSYPAVFDNAIGVAGGYFPNGHDFAYRPDDAVEAVAQGRCRVRTVGGRYRWVDATSFAAPHLSGIVALLLERHPDADLAAMHGLLSRYAVRHAAADDDAADHDAEHHDAEHHDDIRSDEPECSRPHIAILDGHHLANGPWEDA